ncbi:MAG: response regulator [candidate division NC10 bacterium]|nr:response regulator [candidate division NC10 bacterium]
MPKRVLIVEDNPISLELLTELVQAEGHRVITALSGTEALSLARAELPDLILMDIQLPGIDGLTVTRALKAEPTTKEIPVVGISAHALREDVDRALQAGCAAYLSKPLDTRDFIDLMAGLLGNDAQPQRGIAEAR